MLLYVRIEDSLKRKADELVSRGLYPDFNTVTTVALQNLIIAEEEAAQSPGTSVGASQPVADRKTIRQHHRSRLEKWNSANHLNGRSRYRCRRS